MKNKIFAIIIAFAISLPITASAVDEYGEGVQNKITQEITQESTARLDEENETTNPIVINTADNAPYKKPMSKRKLVKKFLLAMLAVAGSSLALYFGLTMYNRIRENFTEQVKTLDGDVPLKTPETLIGAIKVFMEKTKWE